jgi:hypothetical protein
MTIFGYLLPATTVKLGKIDTEGLWGRDPHPPVTREPGQRPNSTCDEQVAYVVEYRGWSAIDTPETEMVGEYTDDPVQVFDHATESEPGDAAPPEEVTHYYRLVVPNIGVYEFADYEIAEILR